LTRLRTDELDSNSELKTRETRKTPWPRFSGLAQRYERFTIRPAKGNRWPHNDGVASPTRSSILLSFTASFAGCRPRHSRHVNSRLGTGFPRSTSPGTFRYRCRSTSAGRCARARHAGISAPSKGKCRILPVLARPSLALHRLIARGRCSRGSRDFGALNLSPSKSVSSDSTGPLPGVRRIMAWPSRPRLLRTG